jgi:C1A family cysteine protease
VNSFIVPAAPFAVQSPGGHVPAFDSKGVTMKQSPGSTKEMDAVLASLPTRIHARFGWVRDLPDHRDQYFSVAHGTVTKLPSQVDLRPQCPPVYDQGEIGSCTANAIAAAIQFDRKKRGQKPDFVPSRLFIYWNERYVEHDVPYDRGAQIRDGVKSISKVGVCPEAEWPYVATPAAPDGRWSPTDAPAKQPPQACYIDAAEYKAITYQRLVQHVTQLRGCLAQGFPFVFGFVVYESFYEDSGQQRLVTPLPGSNDQLLGGHAVLCVGYDDDKQLFTVRNSWGPDEGEGGYFYMPYSYLLDTHLASDFWVIQAMSQ